MQDSTHEIPCPEPVRMPVYQVVSEHHVLAVGHNDAVPCRNPDMVIYPCEYVREIAGSIEII